MGIRLLHREVHVVDNATHGGVTGVKLNVIPPGFEHVSMPIMIVEPNGCARPPSSRATPTATTDGGCTRCGRIAS